jgi:hypothetical protein
MFKSGDKIIKTSKADNDRLEIGTKAIVTESDCPNLNNMYISVFSEITRQYVTWCADKKYWTLIPDIYELW